MALRAERIKGFMVLCRVIGTLERAVRRNAPAGESLKDEACDGEGVDGGCPERMPGL